MKPLRSMAGPYLDTQARPARSTFKIVIVFLLLATLVIVSPGCVKVLGSDSLSKYRIWDAGNTTKTQVSGQPTVNIITPFDGDVRRMEERFNVSGEVNPSPGRKIKMVYYKLNNGKWTEAQVNGHEWAGETGRFPEGQHRIEAFAYDDLGHESEHVTSNFTVMYSTFLDSRYIQDSIPTSMVAGDRYQCEITFQNTGTIKWTDREKYRVVFGERTPGWDTVETTDRGMETSNTVRFCLLICAPEVPGTYNVSFRMKADDEWFGESVNKTIQVYPVVRDAKVIKARIPSEIPEYCSDRAEITIKNTGNGTWYIDGNHPVALKTVDGSSGDTRMLTEWESLAMTEVDTGIGPGCEYTFDFDLHSPPPGEYVLKFRMTAGDNEWFGEQLEYKVRIVE